MGYGLYGQNFSVTYTVATLDRTGKDYFLEFHKRTIFVRRRVITLAVHFLNYTANSAWLE